MSNLNKNLHEIIINPTNTGIIDMKQYTSLQFLLVVDSFIARNRVPNAFQDSILEFLLIIAMSARDILAGHYISSHCSVILFCFEVLLIEYRWIK
jgi:hypothetical protein